MKRLLFALVLFLTLLTGMALGALGFSAWDARRTETILRDRWGANLVKIDGEYYWSHHQRDPEALDNIPLRMERTFTEDPTVRLTISKNVLSQSEDTVSAVWYSEESNLAIDSGFWIEIELGGDWYCYSAVAMAGTAQTVRQGEPKALSQKLEFVYPVGHYRLVSSYRKGRGGTDHQIAAEFWIVQ